MSCQQRFYIAIDLKSFYASVECVERGLVALDENLVVADESRTEKTICLAVSPSLKAYGIPGRARLFEVIQRLKEVNAERRFFAPGHRLEGKSTTASKLKANPSLEVSFIAAKPRMSLYMDYSKRIYQIYLNYISPKDIQVYSIDEVFMDVTDYLETYHITPRRLALNMIHDVQQETKITATAGIGTNLYLAKIAMDIEAKKMSPDSDGVRIAELDEMSYRKKLWIHTPIRDFWRVGSGYAKTLEKYRIYTMGDVARCSIGKPQDYYNEDLLYRLFGVNAELLIDHAWGWEPCTIEEIKAYRPEYNSISSGQVLQEPYPHEKAAIIVREMTELLVLDLVDKNLITDQIVLTIGYDVENLKKTARHAAYKGEIHVDHYGRSVPKAAHGSVNLEKYTSSSKRIMDPVMDLFERITDPDLSVRRVTIAANHVIPRQSIREKTEQLDLFTDESVREEEIKAEAQENTLQHTMLDIKKKFGKNAILKGTNLQDGATTIERNRQVGGHHE